MSEENRFRVVPRGGAQVRRELACPACGKTELVDATDDGARAWCEPNEKHPTSRVEMEQVVVE